MQPGTHSLLLKQRESGEYIFPTWVWALCLFMTALPLLFLPMPPLIDLPGHMGRYTVQLYLEDTPVLQDWYDFKWKAIPNLGFDVLVEIFGRQFGIEPTVRVLTTLTPVLLAAGLMASAKQLHGHVSPLVLFALPLTYHFPFQHGFLNYSLSLAFAFLAFALWMFLAKRAHPIWRIIAFIPISFIIWVSHLFGWAVLCIFIGSFELTRNFERYRFSAKTIWHTSLFCCVLLTPYFIKFLFFNDGNGDPGPTYGYFNFRFKFIFIISAVRDRWISWDIGFVIFCLGWILYACGSDRFKKSPVYLFISIIFTILFLCLPMFVFGSGADGRLVPVILLTFLLAFSFSNHASKTFAVGLSIFALVLFFARMIGNQISLKAYSNDVQAELKMLDYIPKNANLITFVAHDCTNSVWGEHRLTHIPSYALLRKQAFANNQWSTPNGHLITITRPEKKAFTKADSHIIYTDRCKRKRLAYKVKSIPPHSFDYVWAVSSKKEKIKNKDVKNKDWRPIAQVNNSVLYQYIP